MSFVYDALSEVALCDLCLDISFSVRLRCCSFYSDGLCESLDRWIEQTGTGFHAFFVNQLVQFGEPIGHQRSIMEKDKNEELQSRRQFFKKAAKTALPILGAIVLANMPIIAQADVRPSGCTGTCYGTCYGACKGCSTTCTGTCSGSCKNTCTYANR